MLAAVVYLAISAITLIDGGDQPSQRLYYGGQVVKAVLPSLYGVPKQNSILQPRSTKIIFEQIQRVPLVAHFDLPSEVSFKNREKKRNSLCVKTGGVNHLFHRETQKCYSAGSRGPCGNMMVFLKSSKNSSYGICQCKASGNCDGRPIIFWRPTKECFHAYQQGPCAEGQWLVINNKTIECNKNPCLETQRTHNFAYKPETSYYFALNGVCYKTKNSYCNKKKDNGVPSSVPSKGEKIAPPALPFLQDPTFLDCKTATQDKHFQCNPEVTISEEPPN